MNPDGRVLPFTIMQDSVGEYAITLSELKSSILEALSYAHVFSYPLSIDEINKGMSHECNDISLIERNLNELHETGLVSKNGNFYSISKKAEIYDLRIRRNKRAQKYLPWARRISKFIGTFPFVRAVFISGSLSKNSMDKDSDIDYFIITEPGRLWLTRTMLVFFKKIFLFNSYKLFCVNYFVDLNLREIKDQNLYVAHEIATLIPTYGRKACEDFFNSNHWIYNYLPNSKLPACENVPASKRGLGKKFLEFLLSAKTGDSLEKKCKSMTEKFWRRKFKHLEEKDFQKTVVLENDISTHHPDNFKILVLNRLKEIKEDLEKHKNIEFS